MAGVSNTADKSSATPCGVPFEEIKNVNKTKLISVTSELQDTIEKAFLKLIPSEMVIFEKSQRNKAKITQMIGTNIGVRIIPIYFIVPVIWLFAASKLASGISRASSVFIW